jgi:hypothetical protein
LLLLLELLPLLVVAFWGYYVDPNFPCLPPALLV